ncbi:MAG: shikimate kinase, partial [Lachnospiraceae bacterium]|nr:shikimate kinase [Lachnospiraceae bacterium]
EGIAERLGDLTERGVVLREGETLRELYEERVPLYEKYANLIVECENKNIREIVMELSKRLK